MGLADVSFLKKPNAFQFSATDPDDPAVQKTLAMLGVSSSMKIPR